MLRLLPHKSFPARATLCQWLVPIVLPPACPRSMHHSCRQPGRLEFPPPLCIVGLCCCGEALRNRCSQSYNADFRWHWAHRKVVLPYCTCLRQLLWKVGSLGGAFKTYRRVLLVPCFSVVWKRKWINFGPQLSFQRTRQMAIVSHVRAKKHSWVRLLARN
jgi:hypothetical protein